MRLFGKPRPTGREDELSGRLKSAGDHSRGLARRVEERLSHPLDALDKKIDRMLREKGAERDGSAATPSDIKRAGER